MTGTFDEDLDIAGDPHGAETMAPLLDAIVGAPENQSPSTRPVTAPSGWRIGNVMEAWQQARNRILTDDPEAAGDEAALLELLGPEQEDAENILRRLLLAAVHCDDMAALAANRVAEIKEREDRYSKRALATRTAAFHVMEAMGKRRHELPELTASIRAGNASVFIINEDALPADCWRTIPETKEPDKKLIGTRLKSRARWEEDKAASLDAGLDPDTIPDAPPDVPGASLSNSMPSLVIKRK